MKATADEEPERLVKGLEKTQYNYNIKQVTVEEPSGSLRKAYEYDYVEITGKITKAKIIRALRDSKLNIEEEIEADAIEAEYKMAKEAIDQSNLTTLSYEQLDAYIASIANLAEAKAYLKKLSKIVLAILKYNGTLTRTHIE